MPVLVQSKFRQKIHSKWKMRMLNFEQKVSTTDAENSQVCLFTINRYFSYIEATNLQQTLTVQSSLNGTSTTHIFA